MLIKEVCDEYLLYIEVTGSKGSYDYYKHYLKKVKSFFGHLEAADVSNKHILEYIKSERIRNPDISNNTLNKVIQVLKTSVLYCTEIVIIFNSLKETKPIVQVIPVSTVKKIFTYYENNKSKLSDLRNYAYLRLLYDTGLRVNEMNNLKIHNVDMDNKIIKATVTKTKQIRYVLFTSKTKEVLQEYMMKVRPYEYLFFKLTDATQMTNTSVTRFISRLKIKLNIKDNLSPHKWRHTFATEYLRNDGDLETLRLLMGHTNLKTTQRYLHVSKEDLIERYRKVMDSD